MFESILCQVTEHDPDVLESLIALAVEIAREGREGRRVGAEVCISRWFGSVCVPPKPSFI
jgi:hypothetical protein